MAEALAKKAFSEANIDLEVYSRGVSVLLALPASDNALFAMQQQGIDISSHETKQLTKKDLEKADLVLTMTKRHKDYLYINAKGYEEKICTLAEYVLENQDIDDPFGKDIEAYNQCAEQIKLLVNKLTEKLSKNNEI